MRKIISIILTIVVVLSCGIYIFNRYNFLYGQFTYKIENFPEQELYAQLEHVHIDDDHPYYDMIYVYMSDSEMMGVFRGKINIHYRKYFHKIIVKDYWNSFRDEIDIYIPKGSLKDIGVTYEIDKHRYN